MISTPTFNALTQEEQIARLQIMGEQALAELGVVPELIEPLVHAENTTFHVFSPQGEFNLRISRPGYQSTTNIRSEIAFLSALRAEGFRVPDPYQGRLISAIVPEVPEARDCVLFRWMDGEFRRDGLSAGQAKQIGQTMARLHDFTRDWPLPAGFERQHTHAWAFRERLPQPFDVPVPGLSEQDRDLLAVVDTESRQMLRSLEQNPDTFGLIHADLHVGNLLFEEDGMNVIDFDDTGFAFLYYDFSSALAYQVAKPNYREVRGAMLEGYRQVRDLPPDTEDLLKPFLRMRLAGVAGWLLGRTDNPEFREKAPEWAHSLCESIRMLDV